MFFFKKKKIVLDAFTHETVAYKLFSVDKAIKFLPEWWKKLPNTIDYNPRGVTFQKSTMKKCEGFINLYKNGFVIPLWTDIIIKCSGEQGWAYEVADLSTEIRPHRTEEHGNAFTSLNHGKIISPWLFQEKSGINFSWNELSWNLYDINYDIRILPGFMNFNYQHESHINIFFPKKENILNLKAGTPLVHLVPLCEHDVEIKTHLIDQKDFLKMRAIDAKFAFTGNYKKKMDILNKKCPFHK